MKKQNVFLFTLTNEYSENGYLSLNVYCPKIYLKFNINKVNQLLEKIFGYEYKIIDHEFDNLSYSIFKIERYNLHTNIPYSKFMNRLNILDLTQNMVINNGVFYTFKPTLRINNSERPRFELVRIM